MKNIICAYCGKETSKYTSAINQAMEKGLNLYCDKVCSRLGRRKPRSEEEKKAAKREYDKEYRDKNRQKLKKIKAEYHKKTYDPQKERVKRKLKMPRHVEYCRRPEYRAYKKKYDRERRSKIKYGVFWESHILSMEIRDECLNQSSDTEIRTFNNTNTKNQRRKKNERVNRV